MTLQEILELYNKTVENFHAGLMTKEEAQVQINSLNEEAKKNSLPFKAELPTYETKEYYDEESSSSSEYME